MLKKIISLEPEKRTQQDIKIASQELRQTQYFQNFAMKKSIKLLHNVVDGFAQQSRLESYDQGHLLLKVGDWPENFLILLDGMVVSLQLKAAQEIEEEKKIMIHKYPELDMGHNFTFQIVFQEDRIIVKQLLEKQELKVQANKSMFLDSKQSVDLTPKLRKSQKLITQTEIHTNQRVKYFILPDCLIKKLNLEIALCFHGYQSDKGTTYLKEQILHILFDGPIFKYKVQGENKEKQKGGCLTPELHRVDQHHKKNEFLVITLKQCEILSIPLLQFEDLMKSIDKARIAKNLKILVNAFDDSLRSSDLIILMKELVRHTTTIKLCTQQLLYQQGQPCQTLYAVLRGDFELSKEFTYDREYLPTMSQSKDTHQIDLYKMFEKSLNQDRKIQQNTLKQIKLVSNLRSKTSEDQLKVDVHLRDKVLISQVGKENYDLIQLIYNMRKKEGKIQENRKFKQKAILKYSLAKVGNLIGEESFSYESGGGVHNYSCRCVSKDAKIIAIKRGDIYKLCAAFDWFAIMFLYRSQKKSEWLLQRFQDRLAMDLATFQQESDPAHLHFIQQAERGNKKYNEQIILDKFQQIIGLPKDRRDESTTVVTKKKDIQNKKFQNNPLEKDLNVLEGLTQSPRRGINSTKKSKISIQRYETQPFLEVMNNRVNELKSKQLTYNSNDESRIINHLSTQMISKTVDQTDITKQNQIQESILNESCLGYHDLQQSYILPTQKLIDIDFEAKEYKVCEKNQLRLQQYVINKNNRQKQTKSEVQGIVLKSMKYPQYTPNILNSFSSLLKHVTIQHYHKLLSNYKEKIELDSQPLQIKQFSSHLNTMNEPEVLSKIDHFKEPKQMIENPIISRSASLGKFPAGVQNQMKIRQLHRMHSQSSHLSNESNMYRITLKPQQHQNQQKKFESEQF